ncbi:MAG: glycogen-binding domain-containing protein [Candidatus Muiribacteriota bacterium]|jgi:1,4-alpha-glucan branching enzyme
MKKILILLFISIFNFLSYSGYRFDNDNVIFFITDKNYSSVAVAGTFNNWSDKNHTMKKKDNIWEVSLKLNPGKYQYKFVINNSEWILDPDNASVIKDGNFENSFIEVAVSSNNQSGSNQNNTVSPIVIENNPNIIKFKYVDKGAKSVSVVGDFNGWNINTFKLEDINGDGIWEGEFYIEDGHYMYMFVVNGSKWYSDSEAKEMKDDGYGGKNSFITVGQR